MRVLIVEAISADRHSLRRLVEAEGHRVEEAADGEAALGAWRAAPDGGRFDVVIAARHMPGLDGLDLIRRIRADDADGYTYVILQSTPGGASEAMGAGADDHLAKPLVREELRSRLRVASRIVAMRDELTARANALEASSERMRRELAAAARVQRALLPPSPPPLPGVECAWHYEPCEELGGDSLGCFRLDERHLGFYVLDVVGHGVVSALTAVQATRLFTPLMSAGSLLKRPGSAGRAYELVPPHEVLIGLNGMFRPVPGTVQAFTILYGHYDLLDHRLEFASAGHPGPLLIRAGGGVAQVEVSGHPIGLIPAEDFEVSSYCCSLETGDRLLVYTDGAVEAVDDGGTDFGAVRLGALIAARNHLPPKEVLRVVPTELARHRGGRSASDDITLLLLGRTAG